METYKERALAKANAKIAFHKEALKTNFEDRHHLFSLGLSPDKTVSFHVREIRTWAYIRSSIIKRG